MIKFKQTLSIFFTISLFALILLSCRNNQNTKKLSVVYKDSIYNGGIQKIPGKLQCEYYNLGGEGIAYHDTDSTNSGSGKLNKGTDYLTTFRINKAVDISFTKYHDSIDNSKFNIVQQKKDQFYLGWTEPGE